jgi:hypothetical protein
VHGFGLRERLEVLEQVLVYPGPDGAGRVLLLVRDDLDWNDDIG